MFETLQMPTYGAYVWSCYGLTLAALLWLAIATRRRWRIELQQAQRRVQMQAARAAAQESPL